MKTFTARTHTGEARLSTSRARLALLGALLALAGCAPPPVPSPSPAAPNLLLVSIDTLRPDHLGCYGYAAPTSPAIDAFADDAVLFEQAIAHAPSTLHSHASMLTSLLPHHHGASWGGKTRLAEGALSIAEVLRDAGYATAAFTGGGQMDAIFGLDQGFEQYHKLGAQDFGSTVQRGLDWIAAEGTGQPTDSRPFFLFLHTYETHHPYAPPPELLETFDSGYAGELADIIDLETLRAINRGELAIDEADLAHIVAAYDAEIRSMDSGFARLVSALREAGLYDQTMIVFTSDHGEEFGEHGTVGWHSHTLYDELLRVPLLIKYPGQTDAGARVAGQVRSIDIAPTMLAAAGLEIPAAFVGIDLARLATDATDRSAASGLVAVARMDREARRDFSAIRTERWKLMPPPRSERSQRDARWLFDLLSDPAEEWDTAASHLTQKSELEEALAAAIAARKRWAGEQVAPPRTTLDDLRKLGYLE